LGLFAYIQYLELLCNEEELERARIGYEEQMTRKLDFETFLSPGMENQSLNRWEWEKRLSHSPENIEEFMEVNRLIRAQFHPQW